MPKVVIGCIDNKRKRWDRGCQMGNCFNSESHLFMSFRLEHKAQMATEDAILLPRRNSPAFFEDYISPWCLFGVLSHLPGFLQLKVLASPLVPAPVTEGLTGNSRQINIEFSRV